MKELIVCEYPYILYKALIKEILSPTGGRDLMISDAVADMSTMIDPIRRLGLFEHVYFFDSSPYRNYYNLLYFKFPPNKFVKLLSILLNHWRITLQQHRFRQLSLPDGVDCRQYNSITCSDQPFVLNAYLNNNKIGFRVMEHAKNAYQKKNFSVFQSMYVSFTAVLERLHIAKGIWCAAKYCKVLEVHENKELRGCTKHTQIQEWNIDKALGSLTEAQKDQLYQIYAEANGTVLDLAAKYDLLLTTPLAGDSFVPSEAMQIRFYRDIIKAHFAESRHILIKPHPRDTLDYVQYFPDCTVIAKGISAEIFNFCKDLRLRKVLTLCSSSAYSFQSKAEQIIILEPDILEASKMNSLKDYRHGQ